MPPSPHSSPDRQPDAPPDAPGAPTPEAGWQQALEALRALAGAVPEAAAGVAQPARRLLWALTLDADGAPGTIEPLEQVRGPKGWGKPRPVPLARIAEDDRLEPWDARVARAIRRDASHHRRYVLDRAMALTALAGHPGVVLAHAPTQTLDVVEDTPALEAVRSAGRYVLRLFPPVREAPALEALLPAAARQEAEALRQFTLLRDGPHRLRLIRYTPAQFEAARLIGNGLAIPEEGHARLDQTLRALAGQFQIQADAAAGARAVEAEARLRAEVAPVGRGISLRLVVTPLGPLGPRLAPGAGRARHLAAAGGDAAGPAGAAAGARRRARTADGDGARRDPVHAARPRRRTRQRGRGLRRAAAAGGAGAAGGRVHLGAGPSRGRARGGRGAAGAARGAGGRMAARQGAARAARRPAAAGRADRKPRRVVPAGGRAARGRRAGAGTGQADRLDRQPCRALRADGAGRLRGADAGAAGPAARPRRHGRAGARRHPRAADGHALAGRRAGRRGRRSRRAFPRAHRPAARRARDRNRAACHARGRAASLPGSRLPLGHDAGRFRPGRLPGRRHGPGQDPAGAGGAGRARRRRRGAGDRADLGVRQLGRRGAPFRAHAQGPCLCRGRARRAAGARRAA
ncbi:protein of unknown function [Cupriavidus taiwanensis]|uniref:Uncharacterized protein n=1 Tax=Cupriavidus taiwanensis TaxID=164546 RepID=A0A375IIK8_9BURK|nr:protein of unknown function [Cupriavidus taiwanensis]